jgi:N-acetylglucosaminyl-diphospho-decaprenol L-rhamnosyltransferase
VGSPDALAVVVVTHDSAKHLPGLIASLRQQLRADDEFVIVDNASRDQTRAIVADAGDRVRLVPSLENAGFAAGCHRGAAVTAAPLLLFLNPDCLPQTGCLDALRQASSAHPGWGAWQAAVLLSDDRINTSGGVVHYTGIGWAGDCGRPISALGVEAAEVAFASGAALVVRRDAWEHVGGLDSSYFLYVEDLDLGLRLWLAGYGVGITPTARIVHDYEFDKGHGKWFWLERNRWRTVLSVYPLRLLLVLAPALLVLELVVHATAARDGWLAAKLRADAAVLAGLRVTVGRRRRVQAIRRADTRTFASRLTASLDSSYLTASATSWAARAQATYWAAVKSFI